MRDLYVVMTIKAIKKAAAKASGAIAIVIKKIIAITRKRELSFIRA